MARPGKYQDLIFKLLFIMPGLLFIILVCVYCTFNAMSVQKRFYTILAPAAGVMLAVFYALAIFVPRRRNTFIGLFFLTLGLTCFAVAGRELSKGKPSKNRAAAAERETIEKEINSLL